MTESDLAVNLADRDWRLRNLYRIVNKDGLEVPFVPNPVQEQLLAGLARRTVVGKARQHGVTTAIQLWGLDAVLFTDNLQFGVVAHTKEDASFFFRRKLKFAYEHLPASLLATERLKALKNDHGELLLANGSAVRVGTNLRSSTNQILHVSEYGYLCAHAPERARQVWAGALQTVPDTGVAVFESTAEGKEGHFYDLFSMAVAAIEDGRPMHPLEWRAAFFPWWMDSRNRTEVPVAVPERLLKYFAKLRTQYEEGRHPAVQKGAKLSREQMWWYVVKEKELGSEIKREHPSTAEEAFEEALAGAYYAYELSAAREGGRVCAVPHDPSLPVETWWDIGVSDATSVWFTQNSGREIHALAYREWWDTGLARVCEAIDALCKERRYMKGRWVGPPDLKVRDAVTATARIDDLRNRGWHFEAGEAPLLAEQIAAVRRLFHLVWFDRNECDQGLKRLASYRKEWNERLGVYSEKPRHDDASHGASAFACLACNHRWDSAGGGGRSRIQARPVKARRFQ